MTDAPPDARTPETRATVLEQLVYANVSNRVGTSGRGYGIAAHSSGWPTGSLRNSTGGLGTIATYLAEPSTPTSVVVHQLLIGRIVALRSPGSRDIEGRASYTVHALLDRDNQLHPRAAIALARSKVMLSDWNPTSVDTNLASLTWTTPNSRPVLTPHEPVTEMIAHLLRDCDGINVGCAFLVSSADRALDIIEQVVWAVPEALSAHVRFATWQDEPAPTGNKFGAQLPSLTFSAVSNSRTLSGAVTPVFGVDKPPNKPEGGDEYLDLARYLVERARTGDFPPDNIVSIEELRRWSRPIPEPKRQTEPAHHRQKMAKVPQTKPATHASTALTPSDTAFAETQRPGGFADQLLLPEDRTASSMYLRGETRERELEHRILFAWWSCPVDAAAVLDAALKDLTDNDRAAVIDRVCSIGIVGALPVLDVARRVTVVDPVQLVNSVVEKMILAARSPSTNSSSNPTDPSAGNKSRSLLPWKWSWNRKSDYHA